MFNKGGWRYSKIRKRSREKSKKKYVGGKKHKKRITKKHKKRITKKHKKRITKRYKGGAGYTITDLNVNESMLANPIPIKDYSSCN